MPRNGKILDALQVLSALAWFWPSYQCLREVLDVRSRDKGATLQLVIGYTRYHNFIVYPLIIKTIDWYKSILPSFIYQTPHLAPFVNSPRMIERFVAAIDSLPSGQLAAVY